jgi:peptidyl-prolyl cis-trans isomerase D
MMRTMRASAKWIMGVVAFFFVGWMIYGYGMDIAGRGSAAPNIVAKVNGRTVDATRFYQAVRSEQERRRQDSLPPTTTLEDQRQLEDAVFEQMVQNIVLQDEFRRRHINVTDQEIIEAARTSPPPEVMNLPQFQTDGKFDFQKYQRFIASSVDPSFLLALEDRYRDELPRMKLYEQLVAGVYLSDAELWQMYRDRYDSATIVTLELRPGVVTTDSAVQVSDSEVSAYYAAHQDDFKQSAAAYLSYLALSRVPNAADSAAALERARAVRREIMAGGDFADIAARESADSASRAKGGDLGVAKPDAFVPEFSHAAMALRPGQVSEPVQTSYGWHIIKLESKTDSTFHARHILIPIEPEGNHLSEVEARADTLDLFAAEQSDPTVLDRVADELGLPVAQAPRLSQGTRLQLGRYSIGDAGVWAFDGAQPGETSPVIETDWAYYVFRMDSLTPEGIPPLEQIRSQVELLARADKRRQVIAAVAAAVKKEIDAGTSLEAIAKQRGLTTRVLGPFTRYNPPPALQNAPEVAGAAFGLGVGETGGPIVTSFATFFVRPTKRLLADSSTFVANKDALRKEATQRAQQNRVQLILSSIRETAKVDDRRAALEQAQRKAQQQGPTGPTGPTRR